MKGSKVLLVVVILAMLAASIPRADDCAPDRVDPGLYLPRVRPCLGRLSAGRSYGQEYGPPDAQPTQAFGGVWDSDGAYRGLWLG